MALLIIAGSLTWKLFSPPIPTEITWAEVVTDAVHPPILSDIEPADGAVVRGTETWVRWSPSSEAGGRVLWHKAGEAAVRITNATGDGRLTARLVPLELGEKYEYVVEQISGDLVQRSSLRTFSVEGVVFDPPVVEKTIQRAGEVASVQIDSGVKLELPREVPRIYAWRLVDPQDPEKVVRYKEEGVASGSILNVPPGEYGLVVQQHRYYSGSIRWPTNVTVSPGEVASVQINNGIKLELPQEVPRIYAWQLVDSQDPKKKVMQYKYRGVASGNILIVPPGEYGLRVQQHRYYSRNIRWPTNVTVSPGEIASVQIDSGVKLELPQEVPRIYAWRLMDPQDPTEVMQHKNHGVASGSFLIAPPGEYGLEVQQHQYYGRSIRWPTNVTVSPGEFASVQIDSGVKLELPQEVPRIYAWRLMDSQDPKKVRQYKDHGVDSGSIFLVQPGVYDVNLQRTRFDPWKNLSRSVKVERGIVVVLAFEIED